MGSGSSVEYFQYMQQQQQLQQQQPDGTFPGNGNGGDLSASAAFDQTRTSSMHGTPNGLNQSRPGSAFNPSLRGGAGPPPGSAAAFLRQQLLNAGQMLWKSAPDMLQRMEMLEQQNRVLSQEVNNLRGLLGKDELFATLEQTRAENERLKRRVAELEAGSSNNPNSLNASGSPRYVNTSFRSPMHNQFGNQKPDVLTMSPSPSPSRGRPDTTETPADRRRHHHQQQLRDADQDTPVSYTHLTLPTIYSV